MFFLKLVRRIRENSNLLINSPRPGYGGFRSKCYGYGELYSPCMLKVKGQWFWNTVESYRFKVKFNGSRIKYAGWNWNRCQPKEQYTKSVYFDTVRSFHFLYVTIWRWPSQTRFSIWTSEIIIYIDSHVFSCFQKKDNL